MSRKGKVTPALGRRAFLKAAGALPLLAGCGGPERHVPDGVPTSPFDEDSTAEQVTAGIDLRGKKAVVTGCTSGIGFETMRVLAKRGAYVIGTSRSLERAQEACNRVIGVTSPVELDLGDLDSVVTCANHIRSINSPIDILVCNAGHRGGGGEAERINGIEKHFAVNHLGHFVLVNRLLDRLFLAWQGRIVVVSSRAAWTQAPEEGIRFDDLGYHYRYRVREAYGHSKLANALFSLELGRLLRGTRITSNALHPGVIDTEIDRNVNPVLQFAFGVLTAVSGKTVEEGAATSCYVATSPLLGSTSGRFFEDCNPIVVPDSHLQNALMAERLWQVSEELTRDYLVELERPDWSEFENGLRRPRKPAGGDDG